MGTAYKCLGKLKINLVVDGVLRNLYFTATESIKHEMILEMDFIKLFDIENMRKQPEWRVGELRRSNSAWHKFWQTGNERIGIFAE